MTIILDAMGSDDCPEPEILAAVDLQKQGESVFIAINKSNMEESERSKRDEVTLDEGSKISLGLPILE